MNRRILKSVLLMLLTCIVWAGSAVPARAEWDDWLPDFGKWAGDQWENFGGVFGKLFKRLSDTIIRNLKSAVDTVTSFFKTLWTQLTDWLKTFQEFIFGFIEWVKLTWAIYWEYLQDGFEQTWEYICNIPWAICDWLLEWFWWYLEQSFENALSYMDWCVGTGKTIFEKIIDYIPEIELPAGFEEGMQYFMAYGALLDRIFPVTELFYLVSLFFTIYLALLVHTQVKGWWRWIGWLNK